jgi:transcriptional regulator with XRE-family HTH domain
MTNRNIDVAGGDEPSVPSLDESVNEFHRRQECGEYLAQLRKQATDSHDQKSLATALKVSPAFISHIESGRAALPARLMYQFLRALQIEDVSQFGWRLLYAYFPHFFDVLHPKVDDISQIRGIQICAFDDLFRSHDLSERKKDRPLVVLGEFLRLRRQSLGEQYTQAHVADLIGYKNRTAMSNIEMGWAKITSEFFQKWASVLKLPLDKFAAMLLYFYEPVLYDLLATHKAEKRSTFTQEEIKQLRSMTAALINPGAIRHVGVDIQSRNDAEYAFLTFEFLAGEGTLVIKKAMAPAGNMYVVYNKDGKELCRGNSVEAVIADMSRPNGAEEGLSPDSAGKSRRLSQTGIPELQIRDGTLHKMGKTRTT